MAGDVYISFGADTGPLEASFATARAEVKSLQAELNKTANEMRSTGAAADSELGARLQALASQLSEAKSHFSEINEELKRHKESASEAGEAIARLGELANRALEFTGISLGAEAIKEWVTSTQEAAEHTVRLSAQLGATTDQVQEIGAIAKLTGGDFDQMALQLERMQLGLAKSQSATSPARAALAALGIEAEKFRALPIPEQLDTLAEAFAKFADGPNKTAAAMALLGRSGAEMIPALDRGKEGFAELEKAARAAGVVMSKEDVEALAQAKEKSAELGEAVTGLGNQLLTQLNPAISSSVGWLTSIIEKFTAASRAASEFSHENIMAALSQGRIGFSPMDDINARTPASFDEALKGIAAGAGPGGRNVTVRRPPPQVPELQIGGGKGGGGGSDKDDSAEIARQTYQNEVDAARRAAQGQIDALDNLVKQHKISWDTWAKDSTAALETEKAAIQAAANEALKSASLTTAEKMRIANEEAARLAAIAKREADDAAKAAEEMQKAWDSFFKPFNNSIEQMISQVATGHETMRQAFTKTIDSMLADALKFFTQWALHGAEMVAMHAAGNAAIQASDQAGNTAGAAASIAKFASQIPAEIGQVVAGVSAFMAPILGPAAPAAGIAAGAMVEGATHFDIGAWEIPDDMRAVVHRGELVMPAGPASRFRDMLDNPASGAGGAGNVAIHPTTHFHMNALDGASVNSWMRSNGPGMAKALDQAVRHGASLGLKRLNGR